MHKLLELQKIIEERIGSLSEEVEIATNVKLNPLYIVDRKDEIESLRWTTRIIRWVLDRAIDGRHAGTGEERTRARIVRGIRIRVDDVQSEMVVNRGRADDATCDNGRGQRESSLCVDFRVTDRIFHVTLRKVGNRYGRRNERQAKQQINAVLGVEPREDDDWPVP